MRDESGQDISNTPPSCPDEGRVRKKRKKKKKEINKKKKEKKRKVKKKEGIKGVGQHQGLSGAWRTLETVVVS